MWIVSHRKQARRSVLLFATWTGGGKNTVRRIGWESVNRNFNLFDFCPSSPAETPPPLHQRTRRGTRVHTTHGSIDAVRILFLFVAVCGHNMRKGSYMIQTAGHVTKSNFIPPYPLTRPTPKQSTIKKKQRPTHLPTLLNIHPHQKNQIKKEAKKAQLLNTAKRTNEKKRYIWYHCSLTHSTLAQKQSSISKGRIICHFRG